MSDRLIRWSFILGLLVFLIQPVLALAQETPPDGPPVVIVPPDEAVGILYNALLAIVGGMLNAPIVIFLTALGKRWLPDSIPSAAIQLTLAMVFTAAFWIAERFGFEVKLQSVIDLVRIAGPLVLTLFLGSGLSSAGYEWARRNRVPIAGYQRPLRV